MEQNNKEEWRDIKEYEGLYRISNFGNVFSIKSNKILMPQLNRGYYAVNLCKNGKSKTYNIHRIVALHFISNPNNLPCVNHKDENKLNNVVSNLEFCTIKYNTNYGTGRQRMIDKQSKPILQFDINYNFIAEYSSISEAARKLNISSPGNIGAALIGKRKTAYNSIWKYKYEN